MGVRVVRASIDLFEQGTRVTAPVGMLNADLAMAQVVPALGDSSGAVFEVKLTAQGMAPVSVPAALIVGSNPLTDAGVGVTFPRVSVDAMDTLVLELTTKATNATARGEATAEVFIVLRGSAIVGDGSAGGVGGGGGSDGGETVGTDYFAKL